MTHCITNTYEEARKKQLEENQKRFEDLGILKISKSLSNLASSEKSKVKQRIVKPKSKSTDVVEPRRSSRARNPVPSYCDEVDIGLPPLRKRSKFDSPSSWASYLARPLEEVKTASYEERAQAMKVAEKVQSNLQSENPSFIKSMVRSHVYSCFWLGLPSKFCEAYLPKGLVKVVLEDENDAEYEAIYIGQRTGLSGGWRAYALDHKLDDGDALVFERVEPTRFKIYTVKAGQQDPIQEDDEGDDGAKDTSNGSSKVSKKGNSKSKKMSKKSGEAPEKKVIETGDKAVQEDDEGDNGAKDSSNVGKKGSSKSKKMSKKSSEAPEIEIGDKANAREKKGSVGNMDDCVSRESRKRAAPERLFRRRV